MGLIRDLRKARSEATAAVKAWKVGNPRRDGERLAEYRRRCRNAMEGHFSEKYGSTDWSDWLKVILEVLKMIIPLLIVCLLFALMLALPTTSQAADLQWSTLADAAVVAPAVATQCATVQCAVPQYAAVVPAADAGLVRGNRCQARASARGGDCQNAAAAENGTCGGGGPSDPACG